MWNTVVTTDCIKQVGNRLDQNTARVLDPQPPIPSLLPMIFTPKRPSKGRIDPHYGCRFNLSPYGGSEALQTSLLVMFGATPGLARCTPDVHVDQQDFDTVEVLVADEKSLDQADFNTNEVLATP